MSDALVLDSSSKYGRNALFIDPVESSLASGTWKIPEVGEMAQIFGVGTRAWKSLTVGSDGWLTGPAMRGGWALFTVEVKEPRIMVLNATGHTMGYINGEPRAGDLYQYGYVETPVLLQPGTNTFLFATGRGKLRVRLRSPRAVLEINPGDPTAPDLRDNEDVRTQAAVVLVNTTTNWIRNAQILATLSNAVTRSSIPPIPPLGVFKAGFAIRSPQFPSSDQATVELASIAGGRVTDTNTLQLRVRRAGETFKRTFVSELDGSVQYYAINPAVGLGKFEQPALFLSLHGASVEALGQAESYSPKRWGHIVSPTNRRPYAFDWEDWSRLDALEVLAQASDELRPDPSRVYLTGHSMGGHGTWNFGATFPDRFAALAPSAGWISFFSYGGADVLSNATPVEAILRRSAASSDTLLMATNYAGHGIYIIHGDADDNVPISEADHMREVLRTFHHDVDGHVEPGAGHWWDKSDEPGADCVDWAPLFDFFARHRIPAETEVRHIHFVTVNPGVSSRSHWLGIEAQEIPLLPSEVEVQWDPGQHRFSGRTRNAARVCFETEEIAGRIDPVIVVLDGQSLTNVHPFVEATVKLGPYIPGDPLPWKRSVRLEKVHGVWHSMTNVDPSVKNPRRNGPFKEAFRHRMLLVYGTHGTTSENAWALAKARFDSESFWYRGNGSLPLLADSEFDPRANRDRGIILYGHADMNSAWPLLLAQSPVQIRRGQAMVGDRVIQREDLGGILIRPRPDSETACVAVIAGTGEVGLRLLNRIPYFMAGPGYPDCLMVGPEFLKNGNQGIITAGFFGNDWSVENGSFEWSK